ncbi:MAG: hypothetical protein ACI8PG_002926 [Planctomycetota bacterium]|jgi:hypothetical protein
MRRVYEVGCRTAVSGRGRALEGFLKSPRVLAAQLGTACHAFPVLPRPLCPAQPQETSPEHAPSLMTGALTREGESIPDMGGVS